MEEGKKLDFETARKIRDNNKDIFIYGKASQALYQNTLNQEPLERKWAREFIEKVTANLPEIIEFYSDLEILKEISNRVDEELRDYPPYKEFIETVQQNQQRYEEWKSKEEERLKESLEKQIDFVNLERTFRIYWESLKERNWEVVLDKVYADLRTILSQIMLIETGLISVREKEEDLEERDPYPEKFYEEITAPEEYSIIERGTLDNKGTLILVDMIYDTEIGKRVCRDAYLCIKEADEWKLNNYFFWRKRILRSKFEFDPSKFDLSTPEKTYDTFMNISILKDPIKDLNLRNLEEMLLACTTEGLYKQIKRIFEEYPQEMLEDYKKKQREKEFFNNNPWFIYGRPMERIEMGDVTIFMFDTFRMGPYSLGKDDLIVFMFKKEEDSWKIIGTPENFSESMIEKFKVYPSSIKEIEEPLKLEMDY